MIKADFNLSSESLATNLARVGAIIAFQGNLYNLDWGIDMTLTTFALSIAVNILVTGLILFKIVKVSLAAKAFTTSGGTKLQHVIFVIIESGMALLAIQLVRITLYFLQTHYNSESTINAYIIMIGINEMFIVITRYVRFYFLCFTK